MNRIIKAAVAILAAISLPVLAIGPAQARPSNPDLSTYTFDCNTDGSSYWRLPVYPANITVNFTNCTGTYFVEDLGNTTNVSTPTDTVDSLGNENSPNNIVLDTLTVTGTATISIYDSTHAWFTDINFFKPFVMPNPNGQQLSDSSQNIPVTAPSATWGTSNEITAGNEIEIGGIPECAIMPGEHVYAIQEFTVTTSGDYTFRVTGVDPVARYFNPLNFARNPLRDPMVALYSVFDSSNPSTGIVGCNDDLNDLNFGGHDYSEIANPFNQSQQGDYIDGHFSYFGATLEPGTYTMVFTTWDMESASDWVTDSPNGGTVFFDVWGPQGGLTLAGGGSGKTSKLAATGVDASFGLWSALTLMASGAIITIARRRRTIRG